MANILQLEAKFKISINTYISVFGFYGYIKKYQRNIDEYFDKNINLASKFMKMLKKLLKNDKINNNTHILKLFCMLKFL